VEFKDTELKVVGVIQMIELLPSTCRVVSSNPSAAKKKPQLKCTATVVYIYSRNK
jgi:hypothetical protein